MMPDTWETVEHGPDNGYPEEEPEEFSGACGG